MSCQRELATNVLEGGLIPGKLCLRAVQRWGSDQLSYRPRQQLDERPLAGLNDNQIVDLALGAMALHQARAAQIDSRAAMAARLATLSAREVEVMELILEGQLNKQIADRLGIAIRTVEVHRSRVLQKTGARNSVDLARLRAQLQ